MNAKPCNRLAYWWESEYEGYCELPEGHDGPHFDGVSWYVDNDNGYGTHEVELDD